MFDYSFLEIYSFLKIKWKESVDMWERRCRKNLRIVEGGKTVVGVDCMRDQSLFNVQIGSLIQLAK